jgi:carboxypeptidase C (cathepsin A)
MSVTRIVVRVLLGLAVLCTPSEAWTQPIPKALENAPNVATAGERGPRAFVTQHEGVFNGVNITYRATLDETIVKAPDGTPGASLFNFSYTALNVPDAASRPVLFIFNGGPGGSSSILHMGAFGPRRLASFDADARADPNTRLVHNPYTVLDVADLVMLDPPETGFSRLLPGVPESTFRSVDADSYACAQFIAHWLRENGRLNSPIYIVGESYGSLRAVALVRELAHAQPAISVDGIVLIGQSITFGTGRSRLGDFLRPMKLLPGMAAVAWYHGKIDNTSQTLEQAIEKARVFSRTDYISALIQGNRLDPAERERVAHQLEVLTGVSARHFIETDLRSDDYMSELLRDEGMELARNDGRELVAVGAPGERRSTNDAWKGVSANVGKYAAEDLNVAGLGEYVFLASSRGWDYGSAPDPTLDIVLSESMKNNSDLRLLIAHGYFDTTTEIGYSEYTMSQIDLPMDRYTWAYYPGGHMLYSDIEGLKQFTDDVRAWIQHKPLVPHTANVRPRRD